MSDIVTYHEVNPDPEIGVCLNTGETGDGVVFTNVEPALTQFCFIGRQSLLEAMAALVDISPAQLKKLLTATSREREALTRIAELEEELARWGRFQDRAEEAGLVIRELK